MTSRPFVLALAAAAALALPSSAGAARTAWRVSAVQHETTWDWRDTSTGCTSADPHVLAEQGSRKLVSLRPTQPHRELHKKGHKRVVRLAGGIYHAYGPFGNVEGAGRVTVHAVQVTQGCQITGYDEAGDPTFGPAGAPVTDTCDTVVDGSLRTLSFTPRLGRIGRKVAVELREDIGADPDCATRSGFGMLGPDPLGGSIPRKQVALSRFFGPRTTVSLKHTRGRGKPNADTTIVGTTTTRASVTLSRIKRPEPCFYHAKPPAAITRHFVCTPGLVTRRHRAT